MKTAAIVLAAGGSTRLGSPKQLVMIGDEKLLERAVRTAHEAGCSPIVVVLGAGAGEIRAACALGEAMVVVNADWEEGMGASIGCGIAAVSAVLEDAEVDGAVVMACDQPAVSAEHLRALMDSGELTASSYAGGAGFRRTFRQRALTIFGVARRCRGAAVVERRACDRVAGRRTRCGYGGGCRSRSQGVSMSCYYLPAESD